MSFRFKIGEVVFYKPWGKFGVVTQVAFDYYRKGESYEILFNMGRKFVISQSLISEREAILGSHRIRRFYD